MKESELLGKLMPGHPDILPIIENIREKYQLPEVDPEGEPIKEIYLVDKLISLEEFLYDLQSMVVSQTSFLRPGFYEQSVQFEGRINFLNPPLHYSTITMNCPT